MKMPRGAIASFTASLRSSADTRLSSKARRHHAIQAPEQFKRNNEHRVIMAAIAASKCFKKSEELAPRTNGSPTALEEMPQSGGGGDHERFNIGRVSRVLEQTATTPFSMPRVKRVMIMRPIIR